VFEKTVNLKHFEILKSTFISWKWGF